MEKISFENLPQAVEQMFGKLENIERLLNNQPKVIVSNEDEPIGIKDAAEYLRLSVPTLYGYVQKKTIPYSKRGKLLYFSKKELESWIKQGRQRTLTEIKSDNENFLNSKSK